MEEKAAQSSFLISKPSPRRGGQICGAEIAHHDLPRSGSQRSHDIGVLHLLTQNDLQLLRLVFKCIPASRCGRDLQEWAPFKEG